MHTRIDSLYNCNCDDCVSNPEIINLGLDDKFKQLLNSGEKAFKKMHENGDDKHLMADVFNDESFEEWK